MEFVQFGNSPLRVSRMGLGCMGMSGIYGPSDDEESIATIRRALDLGVNFFDTSVSYGSGHNQELIGKAIKGRRDEAILHSKFGSRRDAGGETVGSSASADRVREDCEDTLRRFGVEAVDIFSPSRVDPDIPIEETIGAASKLVEEGKIRFLGLSEASPESIRRANAVHPLVSLQMEFSLFTRDPVTGGNLDACREFGMGLMGYAVFGRGILTGAYRSFDDLAEDDRRRDWPRYRPGNIEHNMKLLDRIGTLAEEKGATLAQIALAWAMAQGADIVPIPGAKSRDHLEENVKALEVELTAQDLARLEALVPAGAAKGERYPERQMKRLNR